jgi:ribonuclease P protein component
MFPKNQRITEKEEFNRIFEKGTALHCDLLMIKILKNDLGIRRFAVIVSKKISNKAVERNRIKRQIREILRTNQERFPDSSDVVVYPKPQIKEREYQEIEERMLKIVENKR